MKLVVPAGDGYLEDIIDELEEIGYSMGLIVRFFALLFFNKIVILLLLSHDTQDDRFKVFVANSHVKLAEFLKSIIQFQIFYVFVD